MRVPTNMLESGHIKPEKQRQATLVTVAGRRTEMFDIFNVSIKGQNCMWIFETYLMQNLPFPTVKSELRESVKTAGFTFLPSQHQISR